MILRPTPDLLLALQAAADGLFVCHPPWSHHVPGWGWSGGGDVSLAVQHALQDLHHARLVWVDSSVRDHVHGDPVVVTAPGRVRLSEWQRAARAVAS